MHVVTVIMMLVIEGLHQDFAMKIFSTMSRINKSTWKWVYLHKTIVLREVDFKPISWYIKQRHIKVVGIFTTCLLFGIYLRASTIEGIMMGGEWWEQYAITIGRQRC